MDIKNVHANGNDIPTTEFVKAGAATAIGTVLVFGAIGAGKWVYNKIKDKRSERKQKKQELEKEREEACKNMTIPEETTT